MSAEDFHAGPVLDAFEISTSDGSDLSYDVRGIYVGTSGNLRVTTLTGRVITYNSLAAGIWHPICAKRVHSTGTTASGIIGARITPRGGETNTSTTTTTTTTAP